MGEKLVLDLETQREFSEVDGRKLELLGVSVVVEFRWHDTISKMNTRLAVIRELEAAQESRVIP